MTHASHARQSNSGKKAHKPIDAVPYPEELEHLEAVLRALDEALEDAEECVRHFDRDYSEFKRYMVEYRNEIDAHEKLQGERLLDQTDRAGARAAETRARVLKLKDSPYFGRIDFAPEGGRLHTYYIGQFGFAHHAKRLVIDWRAPIASVFYDCEKGPASYDAPSGRVGGMLELKRQFKIRNGVMEYVIESSETVRDDVLQRELAHTTEETMKSIISTIQREQNAIIRNERAKTLLIQGVAGSGKTSIALHRVAYLLYRFREGLSARNVAIISPNKVFASYISNVIPELGEEPVAELSFESIVARALGSAIRFEPQRNAFEAKDEAWASRARFKSSVEFANRLQNYVTHMGKRVFVPEDLSFGGVTLSASWLEDRFDAYRALPVKERISRLAPKVREELGFRGLSRAKMPTLSQIKSRLRSMVVMKSLLALYADFYSAIDAEEMFSPPSSDTVEWEDVAALLFLAEAFDGLPKDRDIKHVVIDEMQDYTPIEHIVMGMLFPASSKTVLGDFGQALNPYALYGLEDLRALYPGSEQVILKKSYRSTYEIMMFANRICDQVSLEPLARHGEQPQVIAFKSKQAEIEGLVEMVKAFEESAHVTLGIITKTDEDARDAYASLVDKCQATLLSPNSEHFVRGVSIASVRMAKGLEFDEVIVLDADSAKYSSRFDGSLLYVACTRALHTLTLLYVENPSPLLPKTSSEEAGAQTSAKNGVRSVFEA